MGSADPHGVLGDVDRVKPGRAPALRLGSQSMATGVELMQPPLPEANVPPNTAPREPPVPLDGAPAVTAVEQVIPAHALVVVGKWRRKLTRCLRAAAAAAKKAAADDWLPPAKYAKLTDAERQATASGWVATKKGSRGK